MENGKFVRKTTQDNFITEKVDIFKNNLLGQYDDDGNYEIAPQIMNELIELKKVRKSQVLFYKIKSFEWLKNYIET